MRTPSASWPGAGFLLLVASTVLALGFIAFGLRRPPLDQVGELQLELRLGRREPLNRAELALLQEQLCRHPKLVDDLLEGDPQGLISAHRRGVVDNGWAYLIRTPERSQAAVQVELLGGTKKQEIKVKVRTAREAAEGQAALSEPFAWTPGADPRCATLIEVRTAKWQEDGKKRAPVRIGLVEPLR